MNRELVRAYHERTKHRPDRYAASLGYLDWATQPDPFRTYAGAPRVMLPEVAVTATPTWDALFRPGAVPARACDATVVAQLLYDSLALSAWKQFQGSRWALRVNPSSGNLHPTEGYVLLPALAGLVATPTLCHYAPREHALELRAPLTGWPTAAPGFFCGLTSILWREAWKYGERSFRYCQHDVGHALGALALAAAALGWRARLVDGIAATELAALLAVAEPGRAEREHAEALVWLSPGPAVPDPRGLACGPAAGEPNLLSVDHHEWPVVDAVAEASAEPSGPLTSEPDAAPRVAFVDALERGLSARGLLRQRRSAVAMDGASTLSRAAFCTLLARVADPARPPLAILPWSPAIDLVLCVHRVSGLEPGLYRLARTARADALGGERVADLPAPLELFCLRRGDMRGFARTLCCHQEIAGDSAFALAMLADFDARLDLGAHWYRRLHWEAGVIGQALYVEAEAVGLRATGIGCFFDDLLHEALGLRGTARQMLYGFTVGGPVEDARLQTEPAYAHRVLPAAAARA